MRYLKPHYYDKFCCIADKCPDTCCEGWQIVIDEESLEKYSCVTGPFGNRLYASVNWREGVFRQKKGRCSFLNDQNLCDLYKELGEQALCKTCSMYPRHVEEFEGLRELSLSLSCPVAAKMILCCKEPVVLLEEETEEEEELAEEFEEFDILLFTQLEEARTVLFQIMQDRSVAVDDRIKKVIELAENMQQCIDEERYYDVDEVIQQFKQAGTTGNQGFRLKEDEVLEDNLQGDAVAESRYEKMSREFQVFDKLERLRDEWSDVLAHAWEILYEQGEENYLHICKEFDDCFGCNSEYKEEWSLFTENLMLFFIYTYFCGAVYDDWILSKISLCDFSVKWIRELIMASWAGAKKDITGFDWNLCIQISYQYAREVEHSDDNLNTLFFLPL